MKILEIISKLNDIYDKHGNVDALIYNEIMDYVRCVDVKFYRRESHDFIYEKYDYWGAFFFEGD